MLLVSGTVVSACTLLLLSASWFALHNIALVALLFEFLPYSKSLRPVGRLLSLLRFVLGFVFFPVRILGRFFFLVEHLDLSP